MELKKSRFKTWKLGLNLFFLGILGIILYQNVRPIEVELLFWEVKISLTILLLITTFLGALIALTSVIMIGSR